MSGYCDIEISLLSQLRKLEISRFGGLDGLSGVPSNERAKPQEISYSFRRPLGHEVGAQEEILRMKYV